MTSNDLKEALAKMDRDIVVARAERMREKPLPATTPASPLNGTSTHFSSDVQSSKPKASATPAEKYTALLQFLSNAVANKKITPEQYQRLAGIGGLVGVERVQSAEYIMACRNIVIAALNDCPSLDRAQLVHFTKASAIVRG